MTGDLVLRGDIVPEGQLTLFELAEVANREHLLALRAGVAMLEHAARAGDALIEAKGRLRHGEWLPWLAANFNPSERTAQGYMQIAANPQRIADLDEPGLRKALDAMASDRGSERRPAIEPPPAPVGEFQIVYADPPWRYEGIETPDLRAVERHYPTMPADEIAALEVPAAPDSLCFLWATNPKLREALMVLDAWGFEYRTNLAWVKDRIGMGYYVRGRHELLLIGKRGAFPAPAEAHRPASVLEAPRTEHSAKPAAAYELIEAMYPTASRIELFARCDRDGWESWGALAA